MGRSRFYQKRSYLWSDYLHNLGISSDFLEIARRHRLTGVIGIPHHLVVFGDVGNVSLFFQKGDISQAIIGGAARCQGTVESVSGGTFDRRQLGCIYLLCCQRSYDECKLCLFLLPTFYGVFWSLFFQGTVECLATVCGGAIDGKYFHQAGRRCVVVARTAVNGAMCGLLWCVGKARGTGSDISDVGGDGDPIAGGIDDRVGYQDAIGVADVERQSAIGDQWRCYSFAFDFIYGCQ